MILHLKKFWLLYLLLLVVLYLLIGAVVPFAKYQILSEETMREADAYLKEALSAQEEAADRVMLLETNRQALEERIRLLNQARERIIISTFDMRPGKSADDIGAMLLKKAEEGVKISLLVDGFNGSLRMPGNPFFCALSTHPNLEVRLYNPVNLLTPWTSQGRMHDKYVIVDDFAYILGGRNTFDYFLGEYEGEPMGYDREVLVLNTGTGEGKESSLFEVEDYFYRVWDGGLCQSFGEELSARKEEEAREEKIRLLKRYEELKAQSPELFVPYDYEENTYPTQGVTLLSGETGIYGKEPVVFYELCSLMKQAEERVVIHTPYFVGNDYMYGELEAVSSKVPEVSMMINSVGNGDNFCASGDYLWNKEKVASLGLSLYEYDGGKSYHGKTVVIDDTISIIGSYNFDLRSTYMDTELMLVVESREFNEELSGYMKEMEEQCRRVISETEYEVPEGLTVKELPPFKKLLMQAFGFLAQPFRYLL